MKLKYWYCNKETTLGSQQYPHVNLVEEITSEIAKN